MGVRQWVISKRATDPRVDVALDGYWDLRPMGLTVAMITNGSRDTAEG
jgi:hypothetical protein